MSTRDLLLALVIVLMWGVNFIAMKHAVTEVPPFLLTALRFGLATVPAIFFIPRPAVTWRLLAAYGAAFGIVKFGLLFTAFRLGSPSGLTSVLLQTQAFFTVAFAAVVLGEIVTTSQRRGLVIAALGVAVIAAGATRDAAGGVTLLPVLLVIAAAAAWGLANLALKSAGKVDMLGFTVWSSAVAPLPMLALSWVFEGPAAWSQSWQQLTWTGVATVLYLAWPISLFTGWAWANLLSRYAAATLAPMALLVPIVAMSAGALVYGEGMTVMGVSGSLLVLLGLGIGVFRPAAARNAA